MTTSTNTPIHVRPKASHEWDEGDELDIILFQNTGITRLKGTISAVTQEWFKNKRTFLLRNLQALQGTGLLSNVLLFNVDMVNESWMQIAQAAEDEQAGVRILETWYPVKAAHIIGTGPPLGPTAPETTAAAANTKLQTEVKGEAPIGWAGPSEANTRLSETGQTWFGEKAVDLNHALPLLRLKADDALRIDVNVRGELIQIDGRVRTSISALEFEGLQYMHYLLKDTTPLTFMQPDFIGMVKGAPHVYLNLRFKAPAQQMTDITEMTLGIADSLDDNQRMLHAYQVARVSVLSQAPAAAQPNTNVGSLFQMASKQLGYDSVDFRPSVSASSVYAQGSSVSAQGAYAPSVAALNAIHFGDAKGVPPPIIASTELNADAKSVEPGVVINVKPPTKADAKAEAKAEAKASTPGLARRVASTAADMVGTAVDVVDQMIPVREFVSEIGPTITSGLARFGKRVGNFFRPRRDTPK